MFQSVKTRIIATFLVVVALIVVIASFATFLAADTRERVVMETMGSEAAQTCALTLQLAIEDLDSFKPGTDDYDDCRKVLRSLCQNQGMSYMYAYILNPEDKTSTYVIAAAADDNLDAIITKKRPYGTIVNGEALDIELEALDGLRPTTPIEYNNEFGTCSTGWLRWTENAICSPGQVTRFWIRERMWR